MSRTRRPPEGSSAESSPQFVEARLPPAPPHSTYEAQGYQHAAVPAWLAPILQGITIVILIGFAFWFGALSKTVEHAAKTVEELRASQEDIGNRLTAVETELRASKESVNNRLTAIETRVESMDNRLTVIETKVNSMDKKLDRVTR